MAQFANITPPDHSYVSSQNISYNSYTYGYYGTITLTADSGYKFDTAVTYVMYRAAEQNSRINGVISADNSKCTFTIPANSNYYGNLNFPIIFDGALISDGLTVNLTVNATNCTTNAPSSISDSDTALNIIATANSGFEFDTAPNIGFYDANGYILIGTDGDPLYFTFSVLQSKLSANVTVDLTLIDDFADVDSIIITATAATIQPQYEEITVNTSLNNATISGLPSTVYENTVLQLTATADSDHEFQNAPYIYGMDANGDPITITFTVAQNKLTATVTADLSQYDLDENTVLTVYATAAAVTPYVEKYGTINVYKVTTNDLAAFAAQRFFKEKINASDTSGYFEMIDLGDYVVSVKRFYCAVTDVIADVLKCGNYNTQIAVNAPENDNLTVNCGTVAIPSHNQSITDYNTEIKAFLPFVGFVGVPSDYVGKTISLEYLVNLVTGDCVAKLICNGIVIDFVECSISNDMLYKTNKENVYKGETAFNMQVLKGLQPYVSIKYYSDENKAIYNNDCLRSVIGLLVGYCEITELTNFVNNSITETEKQMLTNALANGVIIENVS